MFTEFRPTMFANDHAMRDAFLASPDRLIAVERAAADAVFDCIRAHYAEIERDYNEASYLYPFWADYPPENRGRAPVGDQIPWIEVGEHAVGRKLARLLAARFDVKEVGLPAGADDRFVLRSDEIRHASGGITDLAFLFLDIKSVGPRDNFNHTVLSPYQVSGDGVWSGPDANVHNSPMRAAAVNPVQRQILHGFLPSAGRGCRPARLCAAL